MGDDLSGPVRAVRGGVTAVGFLPRAVAAVAALLLVACGEGGDAGNGSADSHAVSLVDHQGRTVELAHPPERIVSLVPSATATLERLGARDRLVARTDYDTAQALEHLPSVGGGLEPSMERLIAQEPDVVVRFLAESDPETPTRLSHAGIPHVAVRPDRVDDIEAMVELLGQLVDEPQGAQELWGKIQDGLSEVAEKAPQEPPTVAFLLGGDPPLVAGPNTFLDDLLTVAGARNAFDDLDDLYPPVSVEELHARPLDRVIAPDAARLPDLPSDVDVARVPGWVQQPGPRLPEAARELARAIHGEEWGR